MKRFCSVFLLLIVCLLAFSACSGVAADAGRGEDEGVVTTRLEDTSVDIGVIDLDEFTATNDVTLLCEGNFATGEATIFVMYLRLTTDPNQGFVNGTISCVDMYSVKVEPSALADWFTRFFAGEQVAVDGVRHNEKIDFIGGKCLEGRIYAAEKNGQAVFLRDLVLGTPSATDTFTLLIKCDGEKSIALGGLNYNDTAESGALWLAKSIIAYRGTDYEHFPWPTE